MTEFAVYTGGTFDLFHSGHVELLERCTEFGEVWVSLNTDEFVMEYKGEPPVRDYRERKATLYGCKYVKYVVENIGGKDSKPAIEQFLKDCLFWKKRPLLAIGSDWAYPKDYLVQMGLTWEWLHDKSLPLVFIPRLTTTISTTKTKQLMNDWENRDR